MTRDEGDQPRSEPSRTAPSGQIGLLTLPNELLHSILSYIGGHKIGRLRALRSIALVCRRLRAVALPFLWDRVELGFFSLAVSHRSEDCYLVAAPWSDELLDEICDSGHARHVRELELSLKTFGFSEEYEPTFEHFRHWFPDYYGELWENLREDHLDKLEDMVRNLREPSTYLTEADFDSDLRELWSGDVCFEQTMYKVWHEHFVWHDLIETEDARRCYPLSYIPFDNLPALRLIDFDKMFTDFDEFEQYCRDWPKTLRTIDLTIRTRMSRQPFDVETASAFRAWAHRRRVRVVIRDAPYLTVNLLDTGPHAADDSSDSEEGLGTSSSADQDEAVDSDEVQTA